MSVRNRYSPNELIHQDEATIINDHARKRGIPLDGRHPINVYVDSAGRLSKEGNIYGLRILREEICGLALDGIGMELQRQGDYYAQREKSSEREAEMRKLEDKSNRNIRIFQEFGSRFKESSRHYQNLLETARQNAWKMGNAS